MTDLIILYLFLFSGVITIPVYLRIRAKMTHKLGALDQPIPYYSHRRVLKFTTLIIILCAATNLFIFALFLALKSRGGMLESFKPNDLFLLTLLLIDWSIVATGQGLYISTITLERFTLKGLRADPQFSRQSVATRLFHGPISHIMIYTGTLVGFLLLALVEISHPLTIAGYFNPQDYATILALYILAGLFAGILYYICQIYNLTWRYQLPGALVILTFHISMIIGIGGLSLQLPFNIFLLMWELPYTALLLLK